MHSEPGHEAGRVKARPVLKLRARALQALARRELSRAELHAKLLPHVVETDDVVGLLDDLQKRGWLSDARAMEQIVSIRRRRFGTQRITHELRQKGISDDLISTVVQDLKQGELESAREVWQKKFDAPPQEQKEKARQIRFLQSRGFSMEVIFKVLKMTDEYES